LPPSSRLKFEPEDGGSMYLRNIHIVTCKVVYATNKMGSSSDDWIY
jgi:hypothetical protein